MNLKLLIFSARTGGHGSTETSVDSVINSCVNALVMYVSAADVIVMIVTYTILNSLKIIHI